MLFDQVFGLALKQAELFHSFGQEFDREFLSSLDRVTRFCVFDALELDVEHDIVNLTLCFRKFAVDRKCASDVGRIALVFGTGVDEDKIAVL